MPSGVARARCGSSRQGGLQFKTCTSSDQEPEKRERVQGRHGHTRKHKKVGNFFFVLNLLRPIRFFQELFVLPHKLFTVMRVIFGASRRALPLTAIAGCTLGTVGFEQLAYHLNYAVRTTLISSTVVSFASLAFRNN
jgi:hypothetical protein